MEAAYILTQTKISFKEIDNLGTTSMELAKNKMLCFWKPKGLNNRLSTGSAYGGSNQRKTRNSGGFAVPFTNQSSSIN